MTFRLLVGLLCLSLLAATPALCQDDVMERIRLLEQQIQELKVIKGQQAVAAAKYDDCMKAVSREKFCTCIGNSLPPEASFEQYVHTMVTPRDKLGYDSMPLEQRKAVDATVAAREKCIEKGFFK